MFVCFSSQLWMQTSFLCKLLTFFPNFKRILPSNVLCFLVYMCFLPWSWFKRQTGQNRNCPFTSSVDSAILKSSSTSPIKPCEPAITNETCHRDFLVIYCHGGFFWTTSFLLFKIVTPASMFTFLATEDKRRLDTVGWLLGSWLSLGDNAGTRPSLFVVIYKNNGSWHCFVMACHRSSSGAQATTQSAEGSWKTWTGLWTGLDFGLHFGLDFGLDFFLKCTLVYKISFATWLPI